MKHIKLFENYVDDRIEAKDVSKWVPFIYEFNRKFSKLFIGKIKIPGFENITTNHSIIDLGYGRSFKKLMDVVDKFKNENSLTSHINELNSKISKIREELKDRFDDIFTKKGTTDEYKKLNELREYIDEVTDMHTLYRDISRVNLDDYLDILDILNQIKDDYDLDYYLTFVDLYSGFQLQFVLIPQNGDLYINWDIEHRAQTTKGHLAVHGGIDYKEMGGLLDKIQKYESRFKYYFTNVSIRPVSDMILIRLYTQN